MLLDINSILILLGIGLFAGVVNTLAGGGSLVTLPVLILFLGLDEATANGTNRLMVISAAFVASYGYRSKKIVTHPYGLYFGLVATLGAIIGAKIAIDMDGDTFKRFLAIIMITVGIIIVFRSKSIASLDLPERLTGKYLIAGLIGFFFIGIYGGFLQAGVGGLAASMAFEIRKNWKKQPKIIVVEPDAAPCLFESHKLRRTTTVSGPISSMGRLDCKEPSLIAFNILKELADDFVCVSDDDALTAVNFLAQNELVTTPSGAAGLAAILSNAKLDIAIPDNSICLVIATEGSIYANEFSGPKPD